MVERIRTIDGILKEIRANDRETQISRNFIRNIVIAGKVKSVKSGKKYLVNLDSVLQYLSIPIDGTESKKVVEYGKLRKIET